MAEINFDPPGKFRAKNQLRLQKSSFFANENTST